MTTVRIPPVLRQQVGGVKEVSADGSTVGEVLSSLVEQHPQLREQLLGDDGGLHRFVNVYLNGRDVRYEGELGATVGPDDTLILLPAMAGGAAGLRSSLAVSFARRLRRRLRAKRPVPGVPPGLGRRLQSPSPGRLRRRLRAKRPVPGVPPGLGRRLHGRPDLG